MKKALYDYMREHQADIDTYDTEYDAVVTVCYMEEEEIEDNYDRFCIDLIKKVEVVEANDNGVIVDWSGFIKRNICRLGQFTDKYWCNNYADSKSEFIYQWIKEIHLCLAGYVSESTYRLLNEMLGDVG